MYTGVRAAGCRHAADAAQHNIVRRGAKVSGNVDGCSERVYA